MADKSFGVKELNLLNASGTPTITSPNNLNLNANTVAISTSVTIGHNITVSANAGISSLNVSGIATVVNFNATGISTIVQPADSNPMANWTITNNGASAYRFTGPGQSGNEDNPNIYLVRGHRYIFRHNATGSHPIQIRFANGGAAYTDGVTYSDTGNNRTTDGNNLIFNVQHDAPAQLFYQCTSHGGMVGNIYIVGGPQVISGVVTATKFVGSIDLTSETISLDDSSGVNNNRIKIGTNDDLHLWHNSSTGNSNISNYNGNLYLQGNNGSGTAVNQIAILSNAAVELNYQGNKKFETTSSGATLTGDLYATSRLLVNTTSPGESNGDEATFANPAGNAGITIRSAVNNECKIYFSEGTSGGSQYRGAINYNQNTNYMAFSANEFERMRIDSDGRLLIGLTSLSASNGSADGVCLRGTSGENNFSRASTSTRDQIAFYNPNGLTGRIQSSGSSTNYVTSSDYRLKENVTAISDGITRLKTLKPYRFNFKADSTTTVDGFFAHEVTAVPEAISGTKDEVDSDNNPVYQGIDQSKLVPLLTAALQEAITKIETLEAKVSSLMGS